MIPFGSGSQHGINPILNHCGGRYRQSGAPLTLFPLSQRLKKGPHPGRKKKKEDFWGVAVNTWLLSSLRFYLRLNISTFTCLSDCHPAPTLLSSIPVRLTVSRLQISSLTHRLQYSTTRLARCRPKVHLHERVILTMTHKEERFFFFPACACADSSPNFCSSSLPIPIYQSNFSLSLYFHFRNDVPKFQVCCKLANSLPLTLWKTRPQANGLMWECGASRKNPQQLSTLRTTFVESMD